MNTHVYGYERGRKKQKEKQAAVVYNVCAHKSTRVGSYLDEFRLPKT